MIWKTQWKRSIFHLVMVVGVSMVLMGCGSGPIPIQEPGPTQTEKPPSPTQTMVPPTNTPGIPQLTVRVMAYNIYFGAGVGSGNTKLLADLITLVTQTNPDILGLEEVTGWDAGNRPVIEQFASALNMGYYMAPTPGGMNVALFSKFPILETENLSEYVGNVGSLRAVVQTPDGQKLNVVVVHLDSDDMHLRSCEFDKLRRIMESYSSEPAILMGDINTYPYMGDAKYLTSGGWETVHNDAYDSIFVHSGQTWSATPLCFWAISSDPNCIIYNTSISDHKPVGATISLYDSQNPLSASLDPTPIPVAKCNY